jgi:CRISPR-associated protein Csb2
MALASPAGALLQSKGQVLSFSFRDTWPSSPRLIVPVADALRSAALDAYTKVTAGGTSYVLSGRYADGTPDKEHAHAFYLPEVDDEQRIVGVRVINPRSRFADPELCAVRSVTSLVFAESRALAVVLVDERDNSLDEVASEWQSITPYVPLRTHYYRKPKLAPDLQLAEELRRDLAADLDVFEVHLQPVGGVVVRIAPGVAADSQAVIRTGYQVRFRTARPICGPVVLGHSAHFGLGQFRPAANSPRRH